MSSIDIGGHLNAKPPPFPPELRQRVFVASGYDKPMLRRWVETGGKSEFTFDRWEQCGICIFRRGGPAAFRSVVDNFFQRDGAEANVFEFRPEENHFVRVDLDYMNCYYLNKV